MSTTSRSNKYARQSWLTRMMLNPENNLGVRTRSALHTNPDTDRVIGSKISLTNQYPIPVKTTPSGRDARVVKVSIEKIEAFTNRQSGGSRSRYKKF